MSSLDDHRKRAVEVIAAVLPPIPSYCPDPQCGDTTWDHECGLGGAEPDRTLATAVYIALRQAGMLDAYAAGYSPLLAALDRCRHGRHSKDTCLDCPTGRSTGNAFLEPGRRIGTTLYGEPIAVPDEQGHRSNPARWVPDPGRFL